MPSFRIERDSIGEKKIPENAYYGIFTQRALENFTISGLTPPKAFIDSIVEIKIAAARSNGKLGVIPKRTAGAIENAGNEILKGKFNTQFGLDFFQAGAGTPFNMNVNEVMANRANELMGGKRGQYNFVHPNNHVNAAQSTNDVIPSALRLTVLKMLPALDRELLLLTKNLDKKAKEFNTIIKSGRTHLQDAVPIRLGQEFAAYAHAMENDRKHILTVSKPLHELGLGGTAVGTGFNSHPEYGKMVIGELKKVSGISVKEKKDKIHATQFYTDFLVFSQALSVLAVDLEKIANDLRLLSSGPNTGLNEISLPEVEPGSSIMPGKVNPSILEMVNMVCAEVQGNTHAIEKGVASSQLELNFFAPMIAKNLFESMGILSNSIVELNFRCVAGITANKKACEDNFLSSAGIGTILNPLIGYDRATALVKESIRTGKSISDLIVLKKIMSKEKLEKLLDPFRVTRPNIAKK
jgi:aspartate ammonia-lyase